jgi:excisionase family DNA binding protein
MEKQNSAKSDKILLTLREAAALLGVSPWTLRREVISRRLASVRRRRSGGKILILPEDLNAYIRRYRIAAIGE